MSELLAQILLAAEGAKPPVWDSDCSDDWPRDEFERCLAVGLLRATAAATALTCRECGQTEEVVLVPDAATKRPQAYTRCREVGLVNIPLERLRRWELSLEQLLTAISGLIRVAGSRRELVRQRVWQLGQARWGGATRNVYLARGLHRRDAWQVLGQAALTPRAVVLVPSRLPAADPSGRPGPCFVPLISILAWEGQRLRFDLAQVEAEILVARGQKMERSPRALVRGPRLELIEGLTSELKDHLRAARDWALDTLERTGTPQLLPRPSMDLLAKKIGVHKCSVSRALRDREARELRLLWELTLDLDGILKLAGCRS